MTIATRFDITLGTIQNVPAIHCVVSETGRWVLEEDYTRHVNLLNAQIASLQERIRAHSTEEEGGEDVYGETEDAEDAPEERCTVCGDCPDCGRDNCECECEYDDTDDD